MDNKPHSVTQLVGEKWGGDENGTIRKWSDFVRGDDGSLYGVPFDAPRVIRFDPRDKSLTEIGPDLSDAGTAKKWKCGVKAIGGTIYCAPYMAKKFLKIETATGTHPDSAVRILQTAPLPEEYAESMYTSGALSLEKDAIYYMPARARYILKLVPNIEDSKVTLSKASEKDFGGAGWKFETVCGEDGLIYGIPAGGASRTINFDPENASVSNFNEIPTMDEKLSWGKPVAVGDCIFSLNDKGQVLKLDTESNQLETIGPVIYPDGWGWGDPILGQDGCIYWPPLSAGKVLKFNPNTPSPPTTVGDDFGSSNIYKWHSGVLIDDGFIYCIPYCGHQVLEIDSRPVNPFLNKSSVGGASDSVKTTPDRLKYHDYSEGLCQVVRSIESPLESLCVAIFGTWGSGKSFFWDLNVGELEKRSESIGQDLRRKSGEESATNSERSRVLAWVWYAWIARGFARLFFFRSNLKEQERIAAMMYLILIPGMLFWSSIFSISWLIFKGKEAFVHTKIASFSNDYVPNDFAKEWEKHFGKRMKKKDNNPVICKDIIFLFFDIFKVSSNDEMADDPEMQSDQSKKDELRWSQVQEVFNGTADLYANRNFRTEGIKLWGRLLILYLSFFQETYRLLSASLIWLKYLIVEDYEIELGMTKYIFVKFNAWAYSGTDLLWAKLLETLWTNVERECGKTSVRLHRAKIYLSDENENDDFDTKQNKRDSAIMFYTFKVLFYTVTGFVVTVILYFAWAKRSSTDYNEDDSININVDEIVHDFLEAPAALTLSIASFSPVLYYVTYFIVKFFPLLFGDSKGTQILNQARRFQKFNRVDFSQKTGFMGEVNKEVHYLFDYLRTSYVRDHSIKRRRPLRLSSCIDDLDRCPKEIIMQVLQAVVLLLIDAPITCWLAIDSRIVTAHIEDHFGQRFIDGGLNGYQYLEKIIQLPFCLPDLETHVKRNFLRKMLESNELKPLRIYNRLKFLDDENIQEISKVFAVANIPPRSDPEALHALIPTFKNMIGQNTFRNRGQSSNNFPAVATKPAQILRDMKAESSYRVTSPGQRRLFDEFLHWISVGIESILQSRKNNRRSVLLRSNFRNTTTKASSNVDDVSDDDDSDDAASTDSTGSHPESQRTDSDENDADAATFRDGNIYEAVFQPRASPEELKWFDTYANYLIGKPRKMNRIVNIYMVSRCIARKKNPTVPPNNIFFKNILKFTILLEQWPYRMAWMLLIVENIQQEIDMLGKLPEASSVVPVGENLMSFISKMKGKEIHSLGQKDCLKIPLIDIYFRLVQVLMHSSDDASVQLQRDGDPQLFEHILLDGGKMHCLKFKDIGLSDIRGCKRTLRKYAFNLQTHVVEKVAKEVDNLAVFWRENDQILSSDKTATGHTSSIHGAPRERAWIASYEKKKSIFDHTSNKQRIVNGGVRNDMFPVSQHPPRPLTVPSNDGARQTSAEEFGVGDQGVGSIHSENPMPLPTAITNRGVSSSSNYTWL